MNVYDFDKTIIDDDSSVLFLLFCLGRVPRAFVKGAIPKLSAAFSYATGKSPADGLKEELFGFLKYVPDVDSLVAEFWKRNAGRVEPYYRKLHRDDDVVISASPYFLIQPMADALGFRLIATDMSPYSGKIRGLNCKGAEKVRRFRELYPDSLVEAFYSDSLSDQPMAEIAEQAFLIAEHQPVPWPQGK